MPKQIETKIVPFSSEQMFNLVADIDSYKEFLPWCNDSKIIETNQKEDHSLLIADLEIGYDQFVYTYRSEVLVMNDKSEINVRDLDGPFKYLKNQWKFKSINEHSCQIEFYIDFELNIKVFDILMKKFFDLAFQKMVEAFTNRAKEIY